ncbi:MAG: tetratricopeptide repeat protein [Alphaproteobacteria bacterium]|nr:MAG: tetratricopeptide repeat protein [Alphaproteobacteria bacterium]
MYLSNKGNSLYYLGRYEEAILAYNKTIEINPQYANAWHNKGVSLDNLGRHEEAVVCYNRAKELES